MCLTVRHVSQATKKTAFTIIERGNEGIVSDALADDLIVTPAVAFTVQNSPVISCVLAAPHIILGLLLGLIRLVIRVVLIGIRIKLLLGVGLSRNTTGLCHRRTPFSIETFVSDLQQL